MANDFVNTITTSNGTTYDVQDKRLTATAADAGKVVIVDANGNLVLEEPSGKLSKVATITLSCTITETAKTPNSTTGTIDYTKPMIIQISPNQNITARAIYGGQYSGSPYFYCRASESDLTTVSFDIYQ